jgi:hypothetical protein
MQQELPNLVDERRFRRREPEQFERDEFGRVCVFDFPKAWLMGSCSANGPKSAYQSTWNLFQASIFEPRWLAMAALTSSTSSKKHVVGSRLKAVEAASWNTAQALSQMSPCISMSPDPIRRKFSGPKNCAKTSWAM